MKRMFAAAASAGLFVAPSLVEAQQAPAVGYMFPSGGRAGSTVDVQLGGYDWTPDIEVFVRSKGIRLDLAGVPGPVIVPEPPYWFGKKARRGPFPLPRETPAQLTIPSDLAPGIYRWQAANANGVTKSGRFEVSHSTEIVEQQNRLEPQQLSEIPVVVSGRIQNIKEVDQYQFSVAQPGLVSIHTIAAALDSPLNAVVQVHDENGRLIGDSADTEGRDLDLTFEADAQTDYVVSVFDADFRGNRAYVYRLEISTGPQIIATIPAALQHGETRKVEFVGYGLKSGAARLESVSQEVTAPSDSQLKSFRATLKGSTGLETGFDIPLSHVPEIAERNLTEDNLTLPIAVTGILEERYGVDHFFAAGKKGDIWSIELQSRAIGGDLDLSLAIVDANGKELKRVDDIPGTTDASIEFRVPQDGRYKLLVSDSSGRSGNRSAIYRLVVKPAVAGFTLTAPELLTVLVGGKAQLLIKAQRTAGFIGPIAVKLAGLPAGVTVPDEISIPEKKNDVRIQLTAAADAGTAASVVSINAVATIDDEPFEQSVEPVLLAVTMKPPFSIDAEGKNDVLKWPRGSTFPGPVLVEREESFKGDVVLEMHSRQGRHRQGIRGPELTIPADVDRILYPVFLPEWLETTRTSRMVVNGVAQVADPQGRVRYLSSKLKTRIGFLPGGALLKVDCPLPELEVPDGQPFDFPLEIRRARELIGPATIELVLDERLKDSFTATVVTLKRATTRTRLRVTPVTGAAIPDEFTVKARATILRDGLPVVSETSLLIVIDNETRPVTAAAD